MFTPAQQMALERDRHIIVTANAGAGKTAVLSERFLRIVLDDGVDLDKVVAITFTNKAAAQMRVRIAEKLREIIANANGANGQDRILRATSVLNRMSTARISTFHAFCGALLRKYAREAHLNPDVRELLPRETAGMLQESIAVSVRRWMDDEALREQLLHVIDELGISALHATVKQIVGSSEQLRSIQEWRSAATTVEAMLEARQQQCLEVLRSTFSQAVEKILEALTALGDPLLPSGMDVRSQIIGRRMQLDNAPAEDIHDHCNELYALISQLLVGKGTIRKTHGDNKCGVVMPESALKTLRTLAESAWSDTMEQLQVTLIDTLLALANDASSHYAAAKRDRNGVDFDDLILQSIRLLRDDARVANAVRSSIVHLMVDEFQDTNPAQYELVSHLIPDLASAAQPSQQHCPFLFIVGDGKQSIYGFRNADVRLFERAGNEIEVANARRGWQSGRVELNASFRMAPNCAAAINAVCSQIVTRESEFDVAYAPIVCGRTAVADGVGSFSVIVTNDANGSDVPLLELEASHVANVIARIVSDPAHALTVGKDPKKTRVAGPGDIAILVRSGDAAMTMAEALRARNVPCHVLAGRGFFSRPEIADIRNLLLWATDTADDLAIMALLRSPLMRCNDVDLHHLACQGKGAMWDRALRARDNAQTSDCVLTALARLETFLVDVRVMPLPTFIRTALSACEWHATLVDDPRREQQLANVEKLIELVQDASRNGLASVRDVIMSITEPDSDTEADEQYDTGADAVRIMTIHASKGLDFPIVFLAGISGKGGGNATSLRMNDIIGPTLNLAEAIPPVSDPTTLAPRGSAMSHLISKQVMASRDLAEDRRLAYVGLTRVEDHLFVSLPYGLTAKGELSAASGVGGLLRQVFHDRIALTEVTDDGWNLVFNQRSWVEPDEIASMVSVQARAVLDDGITTVVPMRESIRPDLDDLHASLVDYVSLDMVSATELLDAERMRDEPSATTVSDDVDETRGAAYGTVIHYLLQHAARSVGSAMADERKTKLTDLLASRVITDTVREAAIAEVMTVLDTPLVRSHADRLAHAGYETSLTAMLEGVSVYGVMDVMLQAEDGCVEIWDWKTTTITSTMTVAAAAEAYTEQMQVYAWLTMMAHPSIDRVRTRLVFTKAATSSDTWYVEREWTRAALETVTASLRQAINTITRRRAMRAGLIDSL
jgi:ATP-dependent helicase/nuclease subunit A